MLFLSLIFACKDPIDADSVEAANGNAEAPSDLNSLTAYMFREWNNEDPAVLAAGLENIEAIGADYPVDGDNFAERSFEEVQALTNDDVGDVELSHGYNPSDAGGVGIDVG